MNPRSRWRHWLLLLVLLLAGVVVGLHLAGVQADWVQMLRDMRENPTMLLTATLVYALCLAIPYVPGVELGLMLMIVFGRPGIVMAWSGTVLGLTLAFLLGWFLRRHMVDSPLLQTWRARAGRFEADGEATLRSSALGDWLQPRLRGFRASYPYWLVAALFNLPGNWLIGGGGGIALVSGLSGRLRLTPFVITVALATSVVPLLVWFGVVELERWLPTEATL